MHTKVSDNLLNFIIVSVLFFVFFFASFQVGVCMLESAHGVSMLENSTHHICSTFFTLSKASAKCSNIFGEGGCGRALFISPRILKESWRAIMIVRGVRCCCCCRCCRNAILSPHDFSERLKI